MARRHDFLTWRYRRIFFDVVLFLLSSLVTCPSFMSISSQVQELWQFLFIRTRNPEIRNIPVWVLPNIWRLGWVKKTKFGANIFNKILVNVVKCQGCSFYHFRVIKGKRTGGGGGGSKTIPPSSNPDYG